MTVEIALIISVVSVAFGLYSGIRNLKRNDSKDVKEESAQMATVLNELKNISNGVRDIKTEITNIKDDVKEDRDRITRLEESAKQAHKRLDEVVARLERKEAN